MILNSIRWRLQVWYGLILLAVLAGFGVTAYQLDRGRVLRRIDDELHRRAETLVSFMGINRPNGPRVEGGLPGGRPLPPPQGRLPDEGPPDEGPPGLGELQPPKGFHLPSSISGLFDETDTNGFYYVFIWRDGREFARSANAPRSDSLPSRAVAGFDNGPLLKKNAPQPLPEHPPGPPPRAGYDGESRYETEGGPRRAVVSSDPPSPFETPPRMRGDYREVEVHTPPGERILVGRCIAPELSDFRRTKLALASVGGIVLILGLAGGLWLASRAIRPIQDISSAASKISAGDLSQRINTADRESELGQLAAVLNSTFARLDAAFTQQQQFTSDAAHELRTPISVMLTQVQMALNRERSAPEYREALESCQRAAQRMRRMVESLLELARLDAGQEKMKQMPFDIAQVAQDCCDLIRPLAKERGIALQLDLQSATSSGDPERLAQVVTNFITNAIQYNKPGGEVKVSTHARNGSALLTVADSGQGIAAEDLSRIFERFYRADKSRSSGNAGLGLAITKAIVTAHGGSIDAASQPGVGTTFTVSLPGTSATIGDEPKNGISSQVRAPDRL